MEIKEGGGGGGGKGGGGVGGKNPEYHSSWVRDSRDASIKGLENGELADRSRRVQLKEG